MRVPPRMTVIEIVGEDWLIDGAPTYAGRIDPAPASRAERIDR